MLRSAIVSISLMFLICASAFAQDSKVQVFGGYSVVHTGNSGVDGPALDSAFGVTPGTFGVKTNYSGWTGALQYNANKWFGIKADIGGNYGTPITASSGSGITGLPGLSSYSYLFGPVVSAHPSDKFTPYAHALFGVNRTSIHSANNLTIGGTTGSLPGVTDSAFAMALGGGIDYNVTKRFALRLGQFDYLYTGHDLNTIGNNLVGPGTFTGLDTHQNNFRFATGVVFNF